MVIKFPANVGVPGNATVIPTVRPVPAPVNTVVLARPLLYPDPPLVTVSAPFGTPLDSATISTVNPVPVPPVVAILDPVVYPEPSDVNILVSITLPTRIGKVTVFPAT